MDCSQEWLAGMHIISHLAIYIYRWRLLRQVVFGYTLLFSSHVRLYKPFFWYSELVQESQPISINYFSQSYLYYNPEFFILQFLCLCSIFFYLSLSFLLHHAYITYISVILLSFFSSLFHPFGEVWINLYWLYYNELESFAFWFVYLLFFLCFYRLF